MSRNLKPAALAMAAGAFLALALAATPVRADVAGVTPDSMTRTLRYLGCAFGIAAAASGLGIAAAMAMCIHVLVTDF
jgi:hypothetical protein